MGSQEVKDPMKEMDWNNIGGDANQQSNTGAATQKRLPKKMRQIPDYYFLPRRSLPSTIGFYGSFIVAGIGAGMLWEVWINKKIKEDGGIIWKFDK
ncbi:Dihydrosphingosine phosphate lyase [Dionaea muscipula]